MLKLLKFLYRRVLALFTPARKLPTRMVLRDDLEDQVIQFVAAHPNHNHYIVCRLVATKERLTRHYADQANVVGIMTLGSETQGWCSKRPNMALSCTSSLLHAASIMKLTTRLRGSNSLCLVNGLTIRVKAS